MSQHLPYHHPPSNSLPLLHICQTPYPRLSTLLPTYHCYLPRLLQPIIHHVTMGHHRSHP